MRIVETENVSQDDAGVLTQQRRSLGRVCFLGGDAMCGTDERHRAERRVLESFNDTAFYDARALQGFSDAQRANKAKAPPLLGEDTRGVLRDVLGLDDPHIDSLAAAGVVACLDVSAEAIARQNGTEE